MNEKTIINRINENEKRFDLIKENIDKLSFELEKFKSNKKELDLLNKYYESKKWVNDKNMYENNNISKIKAGILSEDAIWNLNEDINDLINEMNDVILSFNK